MRYSASPQTDGRIVKWQLEGQQSFSQFPYLPVKRAQRITVEADFDEHTFCAVIEESPGKCMWLPFTPDTPSILHRGKGGPSDELLSSLGDEGLRAYGEFREEIRERRIRGRKK